MKLRVRDRILAALAGLAFLAGAGWLVAETFFQIPVTERLRNFLLNDSVRNRAIVIAAALLLLVAAAFLFSILFRHSRRNKGFVDQKTDSGELTISIKAIDALVGRCIEKSDDIRITSTAIEGHRDGLVITLRGTASTGVNIPLVTANLQKQIRSYVTACSGVDVKEVCVRVDAMAEGSENSPYRIAEPDVLVPALQIEPPRGQAEKTPAEEEEERPLHQRLFSRAEEPVNMPQTPAPQEAGEETADEALPEAPDENPDEAPEAAMGDAADDAADETADETAEETADETADEAPAGDDPAAGFEAEVPTEEAADAVQDEGEADPDGVKLPEEDSPLELAEEEETEPEPETVKEPAEQEAQE